MTENETNEEYDSREEGHSTDGHDDQPGTSGERNDEIDEESKQRQLESVRENPEGEHLTTDHGVRVSETDNSLKAGERGPTLVARTSSISCGHSSSIASTI